jgi:hypothetical protein
MGIDLGVGYSKSNSSKTYRSFNDEVSLTADLILGCFVSQFFHKLVSLNVDVLSASQSIRGLDISVEELIRRGVSLYKFKCITVGEAEA